MGDMSWTCNIIIRITLNDLALQSAKERIDLVNHMAELFVQTASENIGKLLSEDPNRLQGVEDKVTELQDALDLMLCFLRDADANQYENKLLQRWVEQIIGVAYEAEFAVEKYIVKVASNRSVPVGSKLRRYLCLSRESKTRCDFDSDIESLKQKVNSFISRLQTYGIETTYAMGKKGSYVSSRRTHIMETYSFLKKEAIFGLDSDISQIVAQLLKREEESRVFAICGKTGLGKTTLAKQIYRQDDIRRHFHAFSWVNVSSSCHIRGTLQGVLGDLTSKSMKQIAEKADETLVKELCEFQKQKKCLVVLDGVCNDETWAALKEAFPGAESGSRLLITTCDRELLGHEEPVALVHELSCLNSDDSWDLLRTKLGSVILGDEGSKLIRMGQELVKYCEGLPLAIVLLSGLLCVRSSFKEWQILYEKVVSCLKRGKQHKQSALAVFLEISYNDLPYYLKPCILHLASFQDGYEILTEKLCQIWVACGFVAMTCKVPSEVSLDNVAETYLNELELRGLIQAGKRGSSGRLKTCYVHHLVQNLLSSKEPECHLSSSSTEVANVRSFMFLKSNPPQEKTSGWLRVLCKEFQLLRVLDLEGASIDVLPREIGELIHLRYLSLRGTHLRKLPSSIGNLTFLQTLDLRVSLYRVDMMIPNVLWKMERLRHLLLPYYNDEVPEKLSLGNLVHLATLKNLDTGIFQVTDLLKLTSIKRLSLNNWLSDKGILKIISKTPCYSSGQLQRLSLRIYGDLLNEEPGFLFRFQPLRRLEIMKKISVPLSPHLLPLNLEVLTLKCCYLEHDPMPILEKLPRLRSVLFDWDSFLGTHMVCSAGGFPQLIHLKLDSLPNLADWRADEGAMVNLKKLNIKYCGKLKIIPDCLPRCVEITFHNRPDEIQNNFSGQCG